MEIDKTTLELLLSQHDRSIQDNLNVDMDKISTFLKNELNKIQQYIDLKSGKTKEDIERIKNDIVSILIAFEKYKLECPANKKVDVLYRDLTRLETEMKIKGSVWGLLGGAVPVIIMIILHFLTKI